MSGAKDVDMKAMGRAAGLVLAAEAHGDIALDVKGKTELQLAIQELCGWLLAGWDPNHQALGAARKRIDEVIERAAPSPFSGVGFEFGGHYYGMCARDSGVEVMRDGKLIYASYLDESKGETDE